VTSTKRRKRRLPNPSAAAAAQRRKDMRDRAVREIAGLMELYWELCNSWCASGDDELRLRMMSVRSSALETLMSVMPFVGVIGDDDDHEVSIPVRIVH
jgi:hypothetical protein